MSPELYTDIQQVIEDLFEDMKSNPLETERELKRYWTAFFAIKSLEDFKFYAQVIPHEDTN